MSRRAARISFLMGLLIAIGLLAWGATFILKRKPSEQRRAPYWRRNDWLSKTLLELSSGGPRGLDTIRVPPGFRAELAATPGLVQYPVFAAFDDRGRLFVCESAGKNIPDDEMNAKPEFRVRLVEDTDGDGVFDRGRIFADKLTMAMGAQWYRGSLYITAPPDILRLEDTDGDGVADRREVILTGWPLRSNGTTFHGPYLGPDGWMYFTYNVQEYNIKTKEGMVLKGPGGRVWRCRPDGTGLEWIVGGGFDNAIEIVFTPAGETIATMTYYQNPHLGLRDALLHFVEGGVYPKRHRILEKYKRTGDPMPAMTKFARIAPSGLARHSGFGWGAAYQGNLFSAQFNPHRVQRHIVERDGATFRTRDEDFLTSTDLDLHPTDVWEDADGSLLVLDTGAWYLHSCPVSRIAKPEVKGTIYRVRKNGAATPRDPWGTSIAWDKMPPAELAKLLEDARPAVRDRALDTLAQRGEASVGELLRVRRTASSQEVRAAAVFGLARIGGAPAAQPVREALSDRHFEVRVAAARMAGLARDREAVGRLMEMVKRDEPAARRQAATALGQIGEAGAVPALLAAAANPDDRFVEHSVIYSLITLGTPAPLVKALASPSPKVRKAALIALDQMDGAPLRREHLAPALRHADAALRRSALWVASHHPDWSGEVLAWLRVRLRAGELSPEEAEAVREALLAFCGDSSAQGVIGDLLADSTASAKLHLLLLDAVEPCPVKDFPSAWAEALRAHLRSRDAAVRARALELVRARQIAVLDDELERIASSDAESDELRALALGAFATRRPALADAHFRTLTGWLRIDASADVRLSAAQVLGRAKLSEAQLLALARDHLPQADALILPSLLDAFSATRSEAAGQALFSGLLRSSHPVDGISGDRIPNMLRNYPRAVQSAAKPLLARIEKEKQSRAERLRQLEATLRGGDPDRGRTVFFGSKAGCSSCHTILTEGTDVGPDLTGIGAIRSPLDLIEAIVFPSASFVPGHEVYRVETAREVYTGVQGESSPEAVVILSGPRDRVRIPRKDIVSMRPSLVSLMPDGFAETLSRQELADVLAFLQSQKYREAAAGGGSQ